MSLTSHMGPTDSRVPTDQLQRLKDDLLGQLPDLATLTRPALALKIATYLGEQITAQHLDMSGSERRNLSAQLLEVFLQHQEQVARQIPHASTQDKPRGAEAENSPPAVRSPSKAPARSQGAVDKAAAISEHVLAAKEQIAPIILQRLDLTAASQLPRAELTEQLGEIIAEILTEQRLRLNGNEQRKVTELLLDDMLGLGPLEPLLADDSISDIMVNGAKKIYIERHGKIELSNAALNDNNHALNIARRIVSTVGRRVDESNPICDARLQDGSRVNIIIPPLALDGPVISIRKFSKQELTLDILAKAGCLSPQMATLLKIAARCRLNILISGGTGSGKTTLLNAISHLIDRTERVVTIEDAAELQLQQPHTVRLETRPPNLEGEGEVTMRDLVKNALRMRPDRIILGEVRGGEAVDMLQAMNTGHDGSLGTIHASRPREAVSRLENMINLAGYTMAPRALRTQITQALDLVIQLSRMRDGKRRIVQIEEILGMEGEVVTSQTLFTFNQDGENPDGTLRGIFESSRLRPHFINRAAQMNLSQELLEAIA